MKDNNLNEIQTNEVPISLEQFTKLSDIQQNILSMVYSHNKTDVILNKICSLAETLLPNSVSSIMLKDSDTQLISVRSAPSVPQVGHEALANLKPGPHGGSCGNAVFRNEAQYVVNTFEDSRWNDIRQVAIDFNICSCWSMPIRNTEGKSIGSFALSSFEHRSPTNFHKTLLETAASLISIVLKNQTNERKVQLFSAVVENAAEGIIITDKNNLIVEINKTFEKIYGYSNNELIGQSPKVFSSDQHNKNFFTQMWSQLQVQSHWSGEITNKKKDGSIITQWMSIKVIYDEYDNVQNYISIFTDLTQLINAQKKLEYMLYHDPLTKLFNKAYLEKITKNEEYNSFILLNVDNFSYLNTVYGFENGDELLINISNILRKIGNTHNIFKFNSDEFALLYNEEIDLDKKIQEIQSYFNSNSIEIANTQVNISFSYGAIYDKSNILKNSASALKIAKENGKNRYYIFDLQNDNLNQSNREAFIHATNLIKDAIDKDKVVPFFQGIYDNQKEKVTKYESLVRIIKNDEIISPFYFLDAARLSGFLPQITKIMIDKTLAVMAKCEEEFSINITEDDLTQNYLYKYFIEKINTYKIQAPRITLEILEGVSSSGKKNHIKQLNKLKSLGLKIAIDDFGTEYSNFERILDLDVDIIKIDAKYIKDIHTNKRSYEITKALVFFAKNVNISCTAEFVHNKEVQDVVKELGIDFSQGYYFSEPKRELIN